MTTQESSLGLNDLALMANIIQVTAERGAIKANEMESVGALYKKLVTFVNANLPQEEKPETVTPPAEETQDA
jgi:hypothetical protein